MNNDDLYEYAEKKGITVDIMPFLKNKSGSVEYMGNYSIAINSKLMENSAEERTCVAHEIGHCETGAFYVIGTNKIQREKAEAQAKRWAVKKLIPKKEFSGLLKQGYQKWELAEYYNVTEDFIETAYHLYFVIEIGA